MLYVYLCIYIYIYKVVGHIFVPQPISAQKLGYYLFNRLFAIREFLCPPLLPNQSPMMAMLHRLFICAAPVLQHIAATASEASTVDPEKEVHSEPLRAYRKGSSPEKKVRYPPN